MRIGSIMTVLALGAVMLLPAGTALGAEEHHVTLTGAAEAPGPGDPDGRGDFTWTLGAKGKLCYQLSVRRIGTAAAAHIHRGRAGVAGPVKVELKAPSSGSSSACVRLGDELTSNLRHHPRRFYVNVHNVAYPNGAIRAQLHF